MSFGDYELILGWREALLGVVAVLVLYVVGVVLRLRLIRRRPAPAADAPRASPELSPGLRAEAPPVPAFADDLPPAIVRSPRERDFAWNEPPQPPNDSERIATLANDVAQLRGSIASLHGEVDKLRQETRQHFERVEATQHVAPIYGDAMQMALAGYDAASIAERCGVARAEADLVVALIRNRDGVPDDRNAGTTRHR